MINLLTNPLEITEDELKSFEKRRELEIIEFQHTLQEMKKFRNWFVEYYCLDIEWYFQWKAYLFNDISEKNILKNKLRISQNPKIGNKTITIHRLI